MKQKKKTRAQIAKEKKEAERKRMLEYAHKSAEDVLWEMCERGEITKEEVRERLIRHGLIEPTINDMPKGWLGEDKRKKKRTDKKTKMSKRELLNKETEEGLDKNIKGLRVGQSFKNYKELCAFFDISELSGASKRTQLDAVQRYFDYDNDGHKYIVTEIYDKPLPDLKGKMASSLINQLIMHILSETYTKEGKSRYIVSFSELIEDMSLVNSNYGHYKRKKKMLAESYKMDVGYVADFYNITDNKLYSAIKTSLNRLSSRAFIDYQVVKVLCLKDELTNTISTRPATEKERKVILDIEYDLLRKYECYDKREVIFRDMWDDFISDVLYELRENRGMRDLKFYYSAFDIVFTDNILEQQEKIGNFLLDDPSKIKNLLNDRIVESHAESYIKRHIKELGGITQGNRKDKQIEDEEMSEFKKKRKQLRSSDDYVGNGDMLIGGTVKKGGSVPQCKNTVKIKKSKDESGYAMDDID